MSRVGVPEPQVSGDETLSGPCSLEERVRTPGGSRRRVLCRVPAGRTISEAVAVVNNLPGAGRVQRVVRGSGPEVARIETETDTYSMRRW